MRLGNQLNISQSHYPIQFQLMILQVFYHNENELHYTKQMLQVEVINCLRLDHMWVTYDLKVSQYSVVVEVVAWQVTNSRLNKVRERVDKGNDITLYVDNCCQLKRKLQQNNYFLSKLSKEKAFQLCCKVNIQSEIGDRRVT